MLALMILLKNGKIFIMRDLTGNAIKNSNIKNEGLLEIGKDKNSKINEIYLKVKPIEIKPKKKNKSVLISF